MDPVVAAPRTSWRKRQLVADEGWGKKRTVRNSMSPWPHVWFIGIAALICGSWLLGPVRPARSYPYVWAVLGAVHGILAIKKGRRRRRLRLEGDPIAKVFD